MKNTKAILLIIIGSFLLATGFAFAGTSATFDSASKGVNFDGGAKRGGEVDVTSSINANFPTALQANADSVVPSASSPKKEGFGAKAKAFLSDHFNDIGAAAVCGYLGYLALGTCGAGLGIGLAVFAFLMVSKLL